MEVKFIDMDPLSDSLFGICQNYKTSTHKLKLCTPRFPIYEDRDLVFLGSKELPSETLGNHLEVYTKAGYLIQWCERQLKNPRGWYLRKEIAPLLLRELKQEKRYIHFFDLIKENSILELNQLNRPPEFKYEDPLETEGSMDDAELLEWQYYMGDGELSEPVLIENSINLRKSIFGDLLVKGDIVMLYNTEQGIKSIEEVEYYGRGVQVAPLMGSGGIYFKYKDAEVYFYETWIS